MSTATLDKNSNDTLAQSLAQELRTWIECESPSNDPAAVHRMAQIVVTKARAAGLRVTQRDRRNETANDRRNESRTRRHTHRSAFVSAY